VALSILIAPIAKAECGSAAPSSGGLSPALRSLPEPAAPREENDSYQATSPDADHDRNNDSKATILGLWKKIYYSGGVLNDIGLDQFSAGGTELLNDVGAFNGGNNFCIGVWKQVGPRSYELVHTFFVLDGSNAIGVSIENHTSSSAGTGTGSGEPGLRKTMTFMGHWSREPILMAR